MGTPVARIHRSNPAALEPRLCVSPDRLYQEAPAMVPRPHQLLVDHLGSLCNRGLLCVTISRAAYGAEPSSVPGMGLTMPTSSTMLSTSVVTRLIGSV